ncbi:MAG TPA: porin [Paucimonas sp.]|nr:porin [Paucimonas sp.]
MEKSILALALAGAATGAAFAQTNVTIYGVADAGIHRKDDGTASVTALESGLQSGSRIGFRGTEDLGGGLSAVFTLENGFTMNDGKPGQGGRLFGRQAFVGLNGGFGSLKLGRTYNPIRPALESIDPFGLGLAGNIAKVFKAYDERADNTINYTTPSMSGFTGQLAYSFGNLAGGSSLGRQIGASLAYAGGPVTGVLAYHSQNLLTVANADNGNARSTLLGGTWNLGRLKAHAAYALNKGDSAAGAKNADSRDAMIGLSAPVGKGSFLASYVRRSDKLVANRDTTQWALGYTHDLSKRTNLYTSYARIDNEAAATLGGAAAGKDPSSLNFGIRHKF